MINQKHMPERQCMGCREHKPKKELLRVARSPGGAVTLDETGKQNGRGVYICKSPECYKRVRKSRALERNLKLPVPPEVYARLDAIITPNG